MAVQVQHQRRENDARVRLFNVVFAYLAHAKSPYFMNAEVKQTSYFHCLQHQNYSPPLLFFSLQAFFSVLFHPLPAQIVARVKLVCLSFALLIAAFQSYAKLLGRALKWSLSAAISECSSTQGSDEQVMSCVISSQAKQEATI